MVPNSLQPLVLKLAHDDASASHAGIQATHTRLIEKYWWQELAADVRTYVSSCHACQMRKPSNTTAVEQKVRPPTELWHTFSIDLLDTHSHGERQLLHPCGG